MIMGLLKKYYNELISYMTDKGLNSLYIEREILREECIPYKIQSYERGYLDRPEIRAKMRRLSEIERKLEKD